MRSLDDLFVRAHWEPRSPAFGVYDGYLVYERWTVTDQRHRDALNSDVTDQRRRVALIGHVAPASTPFSGLMICSSVNWLFLGIFPPYLGRTHASTGPTSGGQVKRKNLNFFNESGGVVSSFGDRFVSLAPAITADWNSRRLLS